MAAPTKPSDSQATFMASNGVVAKEEEKKEEKKITVENVDAS